MFKKIIKLLIQIMPFKKTILNHYAKNEPNFKTNIKTRALAAIARGVDSDFLIETNMGIDTNLKCFYPVSESLIVFGNPKDYRGERGPLELASILFQHTDAFIDIGAHLGYFTFFLQSKNKKNKPIYYFEPVPYLFDIIKKNIDNNRFINIHGNMMAVGKLTGSVSFFSNKSCPLMGSLSEEFVSGHDTQMISVRSIRFADFVKENNLKNLCVKIDIEGAETDFIEGAADELAKATFLIMEVLVEAVKKRFVKNMIDKFGYNAYYINDYKLVYSKNGDFVYKAPEYNWLFCYKSPQEMHDICKGSKIEVLYDGE